MKSARSQRGRVEKRRPNCGAPVPGKALLSGRYYIASADALAVVARVRYRKHWLAADTPVWNRLLEGKAHDLRCAESELVRYFFAI